MYPLQFCQSFELKYFWFPQFVEFSTVFNVFLITSTLYRQHTCIDGYRVW